MRARSVLPLLLLLSACSQKTADPPATYADLDCAQPFDAQVAAIIAQPKLVPAGNVGSEPYSYYSSADGSVSYLVTRKGSPAHPAIMIQRAHNGVVTTGCAYGNKKAYDELLAYLESLKTWTRTGGTKKMTGYHLAQINVGRLRAPIDHPMIADFKNNLERINALAESQPGFVWRLVGEGGDATDIQPKPDDPLFAINMSVWTDIDSLAAFAYRTAHREIMRRRREWFEAMETYMCLWWVPAGHTPSVEEGMAKLAHFEAHGPTPDAFSFKVPFPAPDGRPASPVLDECA